MAYVEEDGFEEGARQVPYVLMREGVISAPARLVLFALMSHQPGSPQLARLSRLDLADQAGIGKAKLSAAEEELEAVGILRKVVHPVVGQGARRQVRYTLMRRRLAEFAGPDGWRLVTEVDSRVHSEPREIAVPEAVPVSVPEAIPDPGREEPSVQEDQKEQEEIATAPPPPPARRRDLELEALVAVIAPDASDPIPGPIWAWGQEIRSAAKRAEADVTKTARIAVMLAALEGRSFGQPPGKNPALGYAAAWLALIDGLTKAEVTRRFDRWGGRDAMRFGGWRTFIERWPTLAEGPTGDRPDPFEGIGEADRYRLIAWGLTGPELIPYGWTARRLLDAMDASFDLSELQPITEAS